MNPSVRVFSYSELPQSDSRLQRIFPLDDWDVCETQPTWDWWLLEPLPALDYPELSAGATA